MRLFKSYKYKGLTIILISILLTILLSENIFLKQTIFNVSQIPILGSFVAGMLYASASTAAFGVFILFALSKNTSAIEIAVVAGLGASFADFVLFRFFKDDILKEITPIYNKLGGQHLTRLMNHKLLRWSLPIIGAFIIASPFPDEVGVGLLGLTKIKTYQFVILSLFLDITGVFLLVSAFSLIK